MKDEYVVAGASLYAELTLNRSCRCPWLKNPVGTSLCPLYVALSPRAAGRPAGARPCHSAQWHKVSGIRNQLTGDVPVNVVENLKCARGLSHFSQSNCRDSKEVS
eukprot:SAG31_NODE_2233_length_6136_cov_2.169455_1_plen_104_part_10